MNGAAEEVRMQWLIHLDQSRPFTIDYHWITEEHTMGMNKVIFPAREMILLGFDQPRFAKKARKRASEELDAIIGVWGDVNHG